MILAAVSSGRSDLATSRPNDLPESATAATVSVAAEPPVAAAASKPVAHGDDFDFVGRLHGSDGVTGVDRTLEGVGESTLVISEICATSSLAATRGRMFLP
jgi:hypothetical protein